MFKYFLPVALLFLVMTSCRTPYIVRNYEYAPPNCDCYLYGRNIGIGGISWFSYKQKSWCTKLNYLGIRDSLSLIETHRDSLMGYAWNDDWEQPEDTALLIRADSLVSIYRQQWVACKIKMHIRTDYRRSDADDSILKTTTVRRKITFYRRGLFRYKKIRKVKYVNDRIIRSRDK